MAWLVRLVPLTASSLVVQDIEKVDQAHGPLMARRALMI